MDDLIGEFITETTESLQLLGSELVKLERDPGNGKILGTVFRLVHTIKGTCGFLGLPRLEAVAHASENVLGKIRDKVIPVSDQAVSLVLASVDAIKTIVEHLGVHGSEPAGDDAELIARLGAFAASDGIAPAAAPLPLPPRPSASPLLERAPDLPPLLAATPAPEAPTEADRSRQARAAAIEAGLEATHAAEDAPAAQSIRVNLGVLEQLMQAAGELVFTRNQLLQLAKLRPDPAMADALQHLNHITTELQETVMKTRMQPIGNAWAAFPRMIRDLSRELSKQIELRMIGAETELDRQLLEMIKDPLTHMVRNCADHGLETPAERRRAGKNETGTVTLSAAHEGGHILIEISDDGRGLDVGRIRRKAVENGLAGEAEVAALSDQQAMQFIFRPGFSTAEKVTHLSGRGVGMDVVRHNIEQIGGAIELRSAPGRGSALTLRVPLTIAIVPVLIVAALGERFALPQINVQELVRIGGNSGHAIERINDAEVMRLRGRLLPLLSLAELLRLAPPGPQREAGFVVVCRVGNYRFGLLVDRVFDTEEIVVKPVPQMLKSLGIYSGSTILGDGRVTLILDPGGLARASGERDVQSGGAVEELKQAMHEAGLVGFLVFTAGAGAPKAVPVDRVQRLEEIDLALQERSGGHAVLQYRGGLMRLRALGGGEIPAAGRRDVVVLGSGARVMGLVVDAIHDIVSAPYDIALPSESRELLGSAVIAGKATDIIDVAALLQEIASGLHEEKA